jgi:hypothetical protein
VLLIYPHNQSTTQCVLFNVQQLAALSVIAAFDCTERCSEMHTGLLLHCGRYQRMQMYLTFPY